MKPGFVRWKWNLDHFLPKQEMVFRSEMKFLDFSFLIEDFWEYNRIKSLFKATNKQNDSICFLSKLIYVTKILCQGLCQNNNSQYQIVKTFLYGNSQNLHKFSWPIFKCSSRKQNNLQGIFRLYLFVWYLFNLFPLSTYKIWMPTCFGWVSPTMKLWTPFCISFEAYVILNQLISIEMIPILFYIHWNVWKPVFFRLQYFYYRVCNIMLYGKIWFNWDSQPFSKY